MDGYFSFLEPIDGYDDLRSIPPEEHSEEFQNRRVKTYEKILQKLTENKIGENFGEKAESYKIGTDGIMTLKLRD